MHNSSSKRDQISSRKAVSFFIWQRSAPGGKTPSTKERPGLLPGPMLHSHAHRSVRCPGTMAGCLVLLRALDHAREHKGNSPV